MDVNGAVVQNVKVTISGQKTIDRVATSNDEGVFEVQNLTPGIYRLKAEQTGHKTTSVSHVEVFVGKVTALKSTLELRFGGLSVEETAAALKISARTVMREWSMAKA